MDKTTTFGKNLRKYREERGISRQFMADKLNMQKNSYAFYETGTTKPDVAKLLIIANILQVSTDTLLDFHLDDFSHCKKIWQDNGYTISEIGEGKSADIVIYPPRDSKEFKNIRSITLTGRHYFIKLTHKMEIESNQCANEMFRSRAKLFLEKNFSPIDDF